jgi:hypothetical protein
VNQVYDAQLVEENIQRVEEMLDSDSFPTHALGETTDYRQVVSAWSKKHGLSFDEMVQALESSGGEDAQRLLDEIRRSPETEDAFRIGLDEPLSGDAPTPALDVADRAEQVHLDEVRPR